MTWLEKTPMAVVMAHVHMMGRLQATESLRRTMEVSVGSGTGKPHARKAQLKAWERQASQGQAAIKPKPGALAAVGIGVRKVNR